MRGAERITTFVEPALAVELDALCLQHGASKSRVIAEAIREYLAARRGPNNLGLAARLPRREGRPSASDLADARRREKDLLKASGRPLRHRAQTDVNSHPTVSAPGTRDAA